MSSAVTSVAAVIVVLHLSEAGVVADEVSSAGVDRSRIVSAIQKSIPLLEKAATGSAREKKCFTCHSQAMPVVALAEARSGGFTTDGNVFQAQIQHTADHLRRGLDGYRKGRGQGGKALAAGYALWTLEAGDWESDELTSAVVHFLVSYQSNDKRWHHGGNRPPSSGSDFATTYFALRALKFFGTEDQSDDIDSRIAVTEHWLKSAEPTDTEDRVFQLRALKYLDSDEETIASSHKDFIRAQHEDGGWSQNARMGSDAYATGTVLVALLRTGISGSDLAINRGVNYLLDSQLEDGSWHVKTRAKAFQTYYETGFPHGKDQFISTSATAWATIALTRSLSPSKNSDQ